MNWIEWILYENRKLQDYVHRKYFEWHQHISDRLNPNIILPTDQIFDQTDLLSNFSFQGTTPSIWQGCAYWRRSCAPSSYSPSFTVTEIRERANATGGGAKTKLELPSRRRSQTTSPKTKRTSADSRTPSRRTSFAPTSNRIPAPAKPPAAWVASTSSTPFRGSPAPRWWSWWTTQAWNASKPPASSHPKRCCPKRRTALSKRILQLRPAARLRTLRGSNARRPPAPPTSRATTTLNH